MGLPDRRSVCCASPALPQCPRGSIASASIRSLKQTCFAWRGLPKTSGPVTLMGSPVLTGPHVPGFGGSNEGRGERVLAAAGIITPKTRARGYGSSAAVNQEMAGISETARLLKSRIRQKLPLGLYMEN